MTDTPKRRTSDIEILDLIDRVELLEERLGKFEDKFDIHEKNERILIEAMRAELAAIRVMLEQLSVDVKEPIEAYKTAKAGYTFVKFLSEAARWLVPIIAGLWMGGYFK